MKNSIDVFIFAVLLSDVLYYIMNIFKISKTALKNYQQFAITRLSASVMREVGCRKHFAVHIA